MKKKWIFLCTVIVLGVMVLFLFHSTLDNGEIVEPVEASDGIQISLEENPTTGFVWEYEVSPTGIVEIAEDRYDSDPYDNKEAISGLGGVHYWNFKVIGEGTVEIRFKCCRGEEELYDSEQIFRYQCDGENAVLLEN